MSKKEYLDISLQYDAKSVSHFLPTDLNEQIKVLQAKKIEPLINIRKSLQNALRDPVEMPYAFKNFVERHYSVGEKVTIMVDDHTRPNVHTKLVLPFLTKKLRNIGVKEEDMQILISSGTHRPPKPEEIQENILGEKLYTEHKDRLLVHNCEKNNHKIGKSKAGTPILIDERLLDSCIAIPLTDSEYHYFAGVAGTVKEFIPGNAGRETVQKNHVKMFHPEKGYKETIMAGNTEGNPVISEIKEMVRKVTEVVDVFCIDCIRDGSNLVQISAGDLFACHEAAKETLAKISQVRVKELADLVIVSAGSLGLNLYQAGKAFHAGWHAVKKNGKSWIVVLASCKHGYEKKPFFEAMNEVQGMDIDNAMKHLLTTRCSAENFEIGDQNSIGLLRNLKTVGQGNLKIISEMDQPLLQDVFRLDPVKEPNESAQEALRRVVKEITAEHSDPTIYLIKDPGILTVEEEG